MYHKLSPVPDTVLPTIQSRNAILLMTVTTRVVGLAEENRMVVVIFSTVSNAMQEHFLKVMIIKVSTIA